MQLNSHNFYEIPEVEFEMRRDSRHIQSSTFELPGACSRSAIVRHTDAVQMIALTMCQHK